MGSGEVLGRAGARAVLFGLGALVATVATGAGCSSKGGANEAKPPVSDAGVDARRTHDASVGAHDAARDSGHVMEHSPDAGQVEAGSACVQRLMDFTGGSGFFGSPFPSDARLTAAGLPDLRGFPNEAPPSELASTVLGLVQSSAKAFAVSASVYFDFSGPLDAKGIVTVHGGRAEPLPVGPFPTV